MRPHRPLTPPHQLPTGTLALLLLLATGCPPQPTHAPRRPPPGAAGRLQGDWHVVSTLRLRDGVAGPTKHLLELTRRLQDVVDGKLTIEGVPKLVSGLVGAFVAQHLKRLAPPWAGELLKRLARIDDALNDLGIESIETLRATGGHRYQGRSRWLRVTVRSGTTRVTRPPSDIPGLGRLTPASYTALERDGRLHLAGYAVHHRIGKVYRWAVEALLGAVTCSTKTIPCFRTVEQAIDALIPCGKLAALVSKASPALGTFQGLLEAGCQSQKKRLVSELAQKLDTLQLKLTFVRLQGSVRPAGERLLEGRWTGQLGKAYGEGTFQGTFQGQRAGR